MSEKQDKDLFPKQYLEKHPGFVIKSGIRDAAGKNLTTQFLLITLKDLNTLKRETNLT